ncbi:MAG: serine acetyltransferase [Phycisphaerae bacterium]|nr:MAG: serine acetyltransferase [Phycisphaerae bacterium]
MRDVADKFTLGDKLPDLVKAVVQSYEKDARTRHIDCEFLPAPKEVNELIRLSLELFFPGFLGRQDLTTFNVAYHVGELLPLIAKLMHRQVKKCLCYHQIQVEGRAPDDEGCQCNAERVTHLFLERIVHMREVLADDVQAAFDGDPAAVNCDEVILAYPGLLAIAVHRLAHELYVADVPMLPRMIAEWAHRETGVDIHPGAKIGRSFFIDHGTGVVIGETSDIGNNVKVYQGVTLGALSFPKDERGRVIRVAKRHPTVEDDVTIYANAIILGGKTVLKKGCVIGGSVFVTASVPENAMVTITPPALKMQKRAFDAPPQDDDVPMGDFQI